MLRLRSKRGKLLLVTSKPIRWPALKRLLVDPEVDRVFVGLAGGEERLVIGSVAEAGADDAVGEVAGVAVRSDVDQLAGEIGVRRRWSPPRA